MFPTPPWMNPTQALTFRSNQRLRDQGGYDVWLKNKQKQVVRKQSTPTTPSQQSKLENRIVDPYRDPQADLRYVLKIRKYYPKVRRHY